MEKTLPLFVVYKIPASVPFNIVARAQGAAVNPPKENLCTPPIRPARRPTNGPPKRPPLIAPTSLIFAIAPFTSVPR